MSWVYPAEIFSANVRAKAVGMATSTNWAFNFALAYAVPPMLNNIKWKTYLVFGTFNACAAIHMFLTAHETKRRFHNLVLDGPNFCRTLEEMDEVFESGLPAWKSSKLQSGRLENLTDELAQDPKLAGAEIQRAQSFSTPAPADIPTPAEANKQA